MPIHPDDAKLRALAEFAAGAGHEINNPVATIVGHVQRLLREETDAERRQALLTIGAQAYRIRDMIADVMLFARPPEPRLATVELAAIVRDVVEQARKDHPSLCFEADVPSDLLIHADSTQVAVVISELVRNAIQATQPPGTIRLRVEKVSGSVRLRVTDPGHGLSDLDREHLFDPFYSGRQAGRGLGFGLCKCWRIMILHGGAIEAASQHGETTFTVIFPDQEVRIGDPRTGSEPGQAGEVVSDLDFRP